MSDVPRALTIAGSDSSGGAGIQADLKTFTAHRVWGATVITALTAQNAAGVREVSLPPADFVADQYDAVLDEAPVAAAKTGMLGDGAILKAVCVALERRPIEALVVDPVLVATSGALLFEARDVDLYRGELIPQCTIVTPNIHELHALTGVLADSEESMMEGAVRLHAMGARTVLVKGGHLEIEPGRAIDLFFDGSRFHRIAGPRYPGRNTHGTGCTLSAAIAARLALGDPLPAAVRAAKVYTSSCIERAFSWEGKAGGLNHFPSEG